ncbi:MAG: nucleotide exchange factor GrpE [Bacteroidales bacterium]
MSCNCKENNPLINEEETKECQNTNNCENQGAEKESADVSNETEELCETDKLTKEIDSLKQKIEEQNNQYLRLMAEYDNFRKRTLKEKSDLLKYGGETALTRILTIIDDFERGLQAIETATDINAVKEGMILIYSKFMDYLKQNNVTVIETDNIDFNTEFHEAITTIPAPSEELKGKILDCVQKGYMINDKVIRFSKVVVGD